MAVLSGLKGVSAKEIEAAYFNKPYQILRS